MEKLTNNLFLLIANLSQRKDRQAIIRLFVQGLNSFLPHIFFSWNQKAAKDALIEVSTQKKIYGEILSSDEALKKDPIALAAIQNAAQMLAIILERLEQEQILNDEKKHLEKIVQKRTSQLQEQVQEFEALYEEYKALNDQLKDSLDRIETSEDQLRSILENSTNVFYRHDTNHRITYLSPQIETILGYTSKEAKVNWLDLTTENPINERGYEHTKKAIETGIPQPPYELELKSKSGKKIHVEVREAPVVKNGKTTAIVGVLVDITEQKKAEAKIHESEKKFKSYIQNAPDGIFIINSKGEFKEMNSEAFNMTGYQSNELAKMNLLKLTPAEARKDAREALIKLTKNGSIRTELPYNTRSGEKRFWSIDAVRLSEDNYIAFKRDVTEKIQHEQKISEQNEELEKSLQQIQQTTKELQIAKEKAEESDRLKSAFLANMSHEIRTPMNGIMGFIDLLQSTEVPEGERNQYLDLMEQSGERLLNTINDIMEISKIEAGQVTLQTSRTNVNEVLNHIYNFFLPETKAKGLKFILKNELDKDFWIQTDRTKLESVLFNLIKNAVKFTSKGNVKFGAYRKGNKLKFFVSDTGVGIPENRTNAIFDRFVQADLKISRPYEGSGLGLSIAKAYSEMIGGKINVKSEVGKGSTFYLSIEN
ncbi:MAG: PAS domain S-box protein [Prolixibacteraceae bacterium]